jgi:hypothetical protein
MGLNQLRLDIQSGKRAGSGISSNSLQEAREGDAAVWRDIRQALEDVGISDEMVTEHRDFIVEWLCKALKAGELEEQPPGTLLSDQIAQYQINDQECTRLNNAPTAEQERPISQSGRDLEDHLMNLANPLPDAGRSDAEFEEIIRQSDVASVDNTAHRERQRSVCADQDAFIITQGENISMRS